jgi:hypothetical protein
MVSLVMTIPTVLQKIALLCEPKLLSWPLSSLDRPDDDATYLRGRIYAHDRRQMGHYNRLLDTVPY